MTFRKRWIAASVILVWSAAAAIAGDDKSSLPVAAPADAKDAAVSASLGPGRADPYYPYAAAPQPMAGPELSDEEGSLLLGKLLKPLRGGGIENGDVFAYPRIPALDVDDPNSIAYTYRPNLIGVEVPQAWDFYNMLASDRPDYTDSNMTVGKDVVLFESGFTYARILDPQARSSTRQLPECLIRSGITNEFELRLRWNGYQLLDQQDVATGTELREFGSQDISVGAKIEYWQQDGWMPMAASVFHLGIPTGSPEFTANAMQPEASFLLG